MRRRIVALVVATTSLVLVSFLVPFALVLRTLAADHATSNAIVQAQSVAPLLTAMRGSDLRLAVGEVNANSSAPVTVFLPDGTQVGVPTARSAGVQLALRDKGSFSASVPGGIEVLVAVGGLTGGTAVIRSFVPDAVLRHGVTRAWLLLLGIGAFLLVLSVVVADQLARSLVRPLAEDQERVMSVTVPADPVLVQVSAEDLAACADVLLENVFTHTPEGAALMVRLSHQAGGGAWLVVADGGPGFPPGGPVRRGLSRGGSTGLGLDIARRAAEASGGTMTIGRSASGGASVTLGLGPPEGLASRRRHRRTGAVTR